LTRLTIESVIAERTHVILISYTYVSFSSMTDSIFISVKNVYIATSVKLTGQ